jgi:importin-5
MITLSEAKPSMVRKQDGRIPTIVRGMGELPVDQASLNAWLEAEVSYLFVILPSSDDISLRKIQLTILPSRYEQSLHRLACAVRGYGQRLSTSP